MFFKFECRGTGRYQAEAIIESRKEDKQFMVKTFESIDPRKNGHAYMARLSFADGKVSREFIDCNGKKLG